MTTPCLSLPTDAAQPERRRRRVTGCEPGACGACHAPRAPQCLLANALRGQAPHPQVGPAWLRTSSTESERVWGAGGTGTLVTGVAGVATCGKAAGAFISLESLPRLHERLQSTAPGFLFPFRLERLVNSKKLSKGAKNRMRNMTAPLFRKNGQLQGDCCSPGAGTRLVKCSLGCEVVYYR